MYKIKVINISFLPRLYGVETMIHEYLVLVWHEKRRPKEVNNCNTNQRTKGQNMVNYQLWHLKKYHVLKILVDIIDHMDFKNSNIRYSKKKKK